ncbi:Putative F-box/FBD/LRR-repeat protein At4g13965 [Linum grandiflorum]
MNNCCVCELGRATKRSREEEYAIPFAAADADRLSYLPDFVIHHILSFLDSKCVVQTSVLSRVWKCVWKHVPVLNFRRDSFRNDQSFLWFVHNFLAFRYQLIGVCKMSFIDELSSLWKPRYKDMFGRVMEYASSHGNRHLVLCLQSRYTFSQLFGPTMSFKTLELRCMDIPSGFGSSSFKKLTTLNLEQCLLCNDQEGVFDLISNFPSLMNLVISDCEWDHRPIRPSIAKRKSMKDYLYPTKIIGPELRSLKLDRVSNTEVVAPRLEFFSLEFFVPYVNYGGWNFQGFSELNIPSLVHADILVLESFVFFRENEQKMELYLDNLFQGLHNAISLVIRCDNDQVSKRICTYVERNRSSFTRLKSFQSKQLSKAATE